MAKAPAAVHITKLAAAQRQLCAAIRMFFAGEDELAIHTVASAAYRILTDLKQDRGRDEVGDHYLAAAFYSVRDYRRGTLPSYLAGNPEAMKWISELAEQLPIDADSKFEDIRASVSPDVAAKFWRKRNKASNFLKHADRDPQSNVALEEIDNLELLMWATGAYVDLAGDSLGNEGFIFWLYFSVTQGLREGLPDEYQHIAQRLEELEQPARLSFCSHWLGDMKGVSMTDPRMIK